MKYCTHCGNQMFDDAVFCTGCGRLAVSLPNNNTRVNTTSQEHIEQPQTTRPQERIEQPIATPPQEIKVAKESTLTSVFSFVSLTSSVLSALQDQ